MKIILSALWAMFLGTTVAAMAQVDTPDAALNSARAANVNNGEAARAEAQNAMNEQQKVQYAADQAAYSDAMHAHNQTEIADAERSDRQQRAYADAMYAWRLQVDACKHGRASACKAPTPNPADYY